MDEHQKSLANQVSEITKLVDDAQERLDQVLRALHTLQVRVAEDDTRLASGGPRLG
jgi:hypothetical protein